MIGGGCTPFRSWWTSARVRPGTRFRYWEGSVAEVEAHRLLSAGGLCRGVTRTLPVQSCEARSCIGHDAGDGRESGVPDGRVTLTAQHEDWGGLQLIRQGGELAVDGQLAHASNPSAASRPNTG